MRRFHVEIRMDRNKIKIIKLIRNLGPTLTDLAAVKWAVEEQISFDKWMSDSVTLWLNIDEQTLGQLYFFATKKYDSYANLSILQFDEIVPGPTSDFVL